MVTLETFTDEDFERFKSWITSPRDLAIFAGSIFELPITDQQLYSYPNIEGIHPFKVVLRKNQEVIGHCELNYNHEVPRLSRILIGSHSVRGKGLGQEIVLKMVEMLFENDSVQKVDLNVFDFNTSAIKCYQNVGFKLNNVPMLIHPYKEEKWTRLNMILTRKEFNIRKKQS